MSKVIKVTVILIALHVLCGCCSSGGRTVHRKLEGGKTMASLKDLLYALRHEYDEQKAIGILCEDTSLTNQEWDGEDDVLIKGSTPLHYAAHYDYMDLVKLLIEYGANANADTAHWWRTPLAWASDAASIKAVEFLLDHGAEVNADIGGGKTALHAAAWGGSTKGQESSELYRKTAELLIEYGAKVDTVSEDGTTPLAAAIESGNKAVEDVLRQHGAEARP